jgi:hypothetical protein
MLFGFSSECCSASPEYALRPGTLAGTPVLARGRRKYNHKALKQAQIRQRSLGVSAIFGRRREGYLEGAEQE